MSITVIDENHPKFGVHTTHCCKIHGCKYSHNDCPVEFGDDVGIRCKTCYDCHDDNLQLINRIRKLQINNQVDTIDELCNILEHEFGF
jgi:hypothetical protein